MALPELALDEVNVVVKGAFNPGIFSPAWLLGQDLIGNEEYEAAAVEVITREVAIFSVGWLRCQVTIDQLLFATTKADESERLRDAVVGVLRALAHTPIGALGINRVVHFDVGDFERWHAIGDALVPKAPWEGVLILPGMKNVGILAVRPDLYGGNINVEVEPSGRVPHGIFVSHNDHFELRRVESQPTKRQEISPPAPTVTPSASLIPVAVEILTGEWVASMKRAQQIISHVARQG